MPVISLDKFFQIMIFAAEGFFKALPYPQGQHIKIVFIHSTNLAVIMLH